MMMITFMLLLLLLLLFFFLFLILSIHPTPLQFEVVCTEDDSIAVRASSSTAAWGAIVRRVLAGVGLPVPDMAAVPGDALFGLSDSDVGVCLFCLFCLCVFCFFFFWFFCFVCLFFVRLFVCLFRSLLCCLFHSLFFVVLWFLFSFMFRLYCFALSDAHNRTGARAAGEAALRRGVQQLLAYHARHQRLPAAHRHDAGPHHDHGGRDMRGQAPQSQDKEPR